MHRIFIAVKVTQDNEFKKQVNSLKRETVKESQTGPTYVPLAVIPLEEIR